MFLPYLEEWETSVNNRAQFSAAEKRRMLLSSETILGLRRTSKLCVYRVSFFHHYIGLAFVEFVRFLFSLKEVKQNKLAFLSNFICQDPLENFFGCQRQQGATNDNPTVQQFLDNTQTLRVVDSFCRGPVKGNCRQKEIEHVNETDCVPLLKRRKLPEK